MFETLPLSVVPAAPLKSLLFFFLFAACNNKSSVELCLATESRKRTTPTRELLGIRLVLAASEAAAKKY